MAKVVYYNSITQEIQVDVGDHSIHIGGMPDGFCYRHGDDCELTDEDWALVDAAEFEYFIERYPS